MFSGVLFARQGIVDFVNKTPETPTLGLNRSIQPWMAFRLFLYLQKTVELFNLLGGGRSLEPSLKLWHTSPLPFCHDT